MSPLSLHSQRRGSSARSAARSAGFDKTSRRNSRVSQRSAQRSARRDSKRSVATAAGELDGVLEEQRLSIHEEWQRVGSIRNKLDSSRKTLSRMNSQNFQLTTAQSQRSPTMSAMSGKSWTPPACNPDTYTDTIKALGLKPVDTRRGMAGMFVGVDVRRQYLQQELSQVNSPERWSLSGIPMANSPQQDPPTKCTWMLSSPIPQWDTASLAYGCRLYLFGAHVRVSQDDRANMVQWVNHVRKADRVDWPESEYIFTCPFSGQDCGDHGYLVFELIVTEGSLLGEGVKGLGKFYHRLYPRVARSQSINAILNPLYAQYAKEEYEKYWQGLPMELRRRGLYTQLPAAPWCAGKGFVSMSSVVANALGDIQCNEPIKLDYFR